MSEEIKEQEVKQAMGPVAKQGNEFPSNPELSEKVIDPKELDELRKQHPYCKFGFFIHVDEPYLYRSFTTGDMKEFTAQNKAKEKELERQLTDDEFLVAFLERYVIKPEGFIDRLKEDNVVAGIPHLLYDLINHLSGFADVEPIIL